LYQLKVKYTFFYKNTRLKIGQNLRTKPSCNAQFELEIVTFGLTRRNWIGFHGQAKKTSKMRLSSEILSQKVKKMQTFDKNPLFSDFDRFLSIFGQRVIREPRNLALLYLILSSSKLI